MFAVVLGRSDWNYLPVRRHSGEIRGRSEKGKLWIQGMLYYVLLDRIGNF